jgi:hypothetical protein
MIAVPDKNLLIFHGALWAPDEQQKLYLLFTQGASVADMLSVIDSKSFAHVGSFVVTFRDYQTPEVYAPSL